VTETPESSRTVFLFPGQGAQHVGMGMDLYDAFPAARRVFDAAEEACGLPLRRLCFEGPEEELARTDVCQPAIFAVSAATLAVMEDLLGPPRMAAFGPPWVAGLSLGEYTALYAAGALGLPGMVRLVARRGELMQQAATAVDSGMVSILGLDEQKVAELCEAAREGQVLVCANFNCPGQIVVSGQIEACRRVAERAAEFGAAAAVPLKVAGAFHTELMRPAAEGLATAMETVTFRDPAMPVIANVDAQPYQRAADIPDRLLRQLTHPIRWQPSMENLLAGGAGKYYEIGPGRVLAGLMRRISREARVTCLNSREALEKLAAGGNGASGAT